MHPARPAAQPFAVQLRDWRQRRRLSQLQCAGEAGISQRHLSFVESGRSQPSREMVLRLAATLDVPLRERNALLLAAGFAPAHAERPLDDPALGTARRAIDLVLRGHEPYPALAVDRHWQLVAANAAIAPMLALVSDNALLARPVNVLRLSLAPGGLAPHIVNLGEWRGHLLDRLRRQCAHSGDPVLADLLAELEALPGPTHRFAEPKGGDIFVPLQLRSSVGLLTFFSTTTVFGTPTEVTLAEIALEAFFPADDETAERMRFLLDEG